MNYNDAPWLSSYGDRKFHLDYPTCSISDKVLQTADECASTTALSYMGRSISYKTLKENVLKTAKAFVALGVKEGDKVTVCMPNVPQAVYSLYALNYIGAIASMIHPLSAEGEIVFYLNNVKSRFCLTLDMFEHKFANVLSQTSVEKLVVGGVDDELQMQLPIGHDQQRQIQHHHGDPALDAAARGVVEEHGDTGDAAGDDARGPVEPKEGQGLQGDGDERQKDVARLPPQKQLFEIRIADTAQLCQLLRMELTGEKFLPNAVKGRFDE